MNTYEVPWSAFGVAVVKAESAKQAKEMVSDGCFNFDDIDFESNEVNGATIHDAEEKR